MKKIMLTLIAILALSASLCACIKKKGDKVIDRFDTLTDKMSYQALSSIKMLEVKDEFKSTKNLSGTTLINQEQVTEKEVIEKYLGMMEEIIGTNGGMKTTVLVSDKPEYTNLITITTTRLHNEETVYSLYYNETVVNDLDDDDDDDEIKEVKKITGVALVGDKEYKLEGMVETETENKGLSKESETESTIKIIEDQNNYVIVKEEVEQETNEFEHEYKYTVVSNGRKVSELEFEVEQENNEISVELKEVTRDTKTSYKFKVIEENNTKYIKVEVKNGTEITKIKARIVYDAQTNTYKYDYKYIENGNK